MASILKVDTLQDQAGNNIISESANVITIGASGDTITIPSGASMSGFNSTGIDDNATSTILTVQNDGLVSGTTATYNIGSSSNLWKDLWLKNGGRVYFADSGTAIYGSNSLDIFTFSLNSSERMRLNTTGLGIGTSSPDELLQIEGDQPTYKLTSTNALSTAVGTETIADIDFEGQNNNLYRTTAKIRARQDGTWSAATSNFAPTALDFFTQDNSTSDAMTSPRMTINEDGNVGIGTTTIPEILTVNKSSNGAITGLSINNDYPTTSTASSGTGSGIRFGVNDGTFNSAFGDGRGSEILSVTTSTNGRSRDIVFKTDSGGTLGEVMRIDSSGNVGIGTSSPQEKLEVSGNILIANNNALKINDTSSAKEILKVDNFNQTILKNANDSRDIIIRNAADTNLVTIDPTGDVSITGALSKGSGSFKIDHPLPSKNSTHYLVHSFTESPQADLIYRGKVDLVNGTATVNIDTVAGMSEGTFVLLNRDIQCFTSNETGWTAVKGSVSGNTLTITAQDNTCDDTISWLVVGERQDQHMYDTSWTDENGKVIVEPLKETEQQP
jgi:hypothetical protein